MQISTSDIIASAALLVAAYTFWFQYRFEFEKGRKKGGYGIREFRLMDNTLIAVARQADVEEFFDHYRVFEISLERRKRKYIYVYKQNIATILRDF